MTSKLKKASDARLWLAERLLSARVAWHAAKTAHERAVAEAEASPDDDLARRREVAAFSKTLEADNDWDRLDGHIQDIANKGTPE